MLACVSQQAGRLDDRKARNNSLDNFTVHKSISTKAEKLEEERQRKRQELELYNRKNEEYLNSVAANRYIKQQERQYMADQYDDMINRRKMKEME